MQIRKKWYVDQSEVIRLAYDLEQRGFSTKEVIYLVEKPWKYSGEYALMLARQETSVEVQCRECGSRWEVHGANLDDDGEVFVGCPNCGEMVTAKLVTEEV